jgi:membrane protein implicated in regulation of membrane protease activity
MQSLGNATTAQDKKITLRASTLSLAVMVTVFLVAVVFAANQNDVIGWIVAIVSLGWLMLSAFLVFGLRRGARKMTDQLKTATAGMAARAGGPSQTVVVDEATRNRDLKLDHSLKIVQVQAGVIKENLGRSGEDARAMVDRAVETIEITAHNARSMMKPSDGSQPLSGEVID